MANALIYTLVESGETSVLKPNKIKRRLTHFLYFILLSKTRPMTHIGSLIRQSANVTLKTST